MVRWLDASNHPQVHHNPQGPYAFGPSRSHSKPSISITVYESLRIPYVHSYLEHFESSTMSLDPRLHLQHVRIRCLQHTCVKLSTSSSYRAAISEPVPVVVKDSAVSSGNIRACPSTVVAKPQRRLDHATQIPFLAQSSAVIRGVLLPKVEVTAAQSGSYCCPKWKLLLPKVEVTAAQSGSYCCPKWKFGATPRHEGANNINRMQEESV